MNNKVSNCSINMNKPIWYTRSCIDLKQDKNNTISLNQPINLDTKVKLNVGGIRFETSLKTLKNIPKSRLSNLNTNDENYDPILDEYYFDRSPYLFDYILNYYRIGELHVPMSECGSAFKNELEYWNLSEDNILPCCWLTYSKSKDYKHTLKQFDNSFFTSDDHKTEEQKDREENYHEIIKFNKLKNFLEKFWASSEYPFRNPHGYIYFFLSTFFVLLSLFSEIFSSVRPWYINIEYAFDNKTQRNIMVKGQPSEFFKASDIICAIYFTIEFLLRIISCPSFILFLKSIFNWIEFITLLSIYIQIVITVVYPSQACYLPTNCSTTFLRVLSIFQLIRMIRVIKLFKNYTGMRVMAYTIKSSFKELCLIISLLMTGVCLFGSLIYAVEGDPDRTDGFINIPISFWFAITTMTTIGFGDVMPSTTLGYIVGSMCAICGVLVVAFTVPIAVNNFTFFYTYAHSRSKYKNLKHNETIQK